MFLLQKPCRNNYFLSAATRFKAKPCACAYLLQGRERGVAMSEIKSSVGEAESGQVSQSQILWQRKTLGQTGLLTLVDQLLHLCVQTQICRTHVETKLLRDSLTLSLLFLFYFEANSNGHIISDRPDSSNLLPSGSRLSNTDSRFHKLWELCRHKQFV